MGVELQHCVVYGYELAERINYDERDDLLEYADKDAEEGDFVVLQGRGSKPVAGIVRVMTDSVRWDGPQRIPITHCEEPPSFVSSTLDTMMDAVDLPTEPDHPEPNHIVFTYDW